MKPERHQRRNPGARIEVSRLESRRLLSAAVWSVGPSLPMAAAQQAVIAEGGTIFEFGGGSQTVATLSSGASAWGTASPLDIPRVAPGAGVSSTGIVVFGGKSGEVLDAASSYDPAGNNTQDAASMISSRWRMAYASDSNGRVFAIGGQDINGVVLASAEAFDGSSWNSIAALPSARLGAAAVDDGAGHLFVFGGASTTASDSLTNTNYEYSISTDTWATAAPMPTAVRDEAAVLGSNGLIYVLGGISAAGTTAAVQVYNPATNAWAYDTSLPAPLSSEGAATDGLGRINVIGGFNASGQATTNVWQSQRLNQPETAPAFTSLPVTKASASAPYSYQAVASANPQATYSLISGPAGMKIDPNTGLVTWQPTPAQAGLQSVDIRASNRIGQTDQSFTINTLLENVAPTAPTNVHVISETTSSVTLGFTASTDAYGIAGYRVYWTYGHSGRGGGYTTVLLLNHPGAGTTLTVGGLQTGRSYSLSVAAYNTSGYESARTPVFLTVYSLPTLYVYPSSTTIAAKHLFAFTAYGLAFPAYTYSLQNAPAGMMINPLTGAGTWTPAPSQTGIFEVTVVGTNAAGISKSTMTVTVNPDVPALSYQINPTTGAGYGLVDVPMTIKVNDGSLTTTTYSIISGPSGLALNAATGLLSWTPSPSQAGNTAIDIRGKNLYGTTDLIIKFPTYITPAVTQIVVLNTTLLNPTLSWTAPVSKNAAAIAGYTITLIGYGNSQYSSLTFDTKSAKTTFVLKGLTQGLYYYTPVITPYDAAGNPGVTATGANFTYVPNLPVIGYTGTPSQTIVGQPLNLKITNTNSSLPATFAIVRAPAGLTINPTTGVVTWIPTAAQAGPQTATFSVTNSVGEVTQIINLGVFPTSAPTSLSFSNKTSTGFQIAWQPPALNPSAVAGYHIVVYAGNTHTSYSVWASTRTFAVPASWVGYVYVVWITAYDSHGVDGLVGVLNVPF